MEMYFLGTLGIVLAIMAGFLAFILSPVIAIVFSMIWPARPVSPAAPSATPWYRSKTAFFGYVAIGVISLILIWTLGPDSFLGLMALIFGAAIVLYGAMKSSSSTGPIWAVGVVGAIIFGFFLIALYHFAVYGFSAGQVMLGEFVGSIPNWFTGWDGAGTFPALSSVLMLAALVAGIYLLVWKSHWIGGAIALAVILMSWFGTDNVINTGRNIGASLESASSGEASASTRRVTTEVVAPVGEMSQPFTIHSSKCIAWEGHDPATENYKVWYLTIYNEWTTHRPSEAKAVAFESCTDEPAILKVWYGPKNTCT